MAARAAQKHLYRLAEDPDWQVMLTTHSPYFIDPLACHTTIIRLERASDDEKAPVTPRTFRSETIEFDGNTKQRLQALQQMDTSLAEIFFGSYPVLVEGDTEHAAFLAAVLKQDHALADSVTVVRARGKAILVPLIEIMDHFRVSFGILHDTDAPFKTDGSVSGMWTENGKIRDKIMKCRANGLRVRHKVSVPNFDYYLVGEPIEKGKPLIAYEKILGDQKLQTMVQRLLTSLLDGDDMEPFDKATMESGDYMAVLREQTLIWARSRDLVDEMYFRGKSAATD
jgi:hypothetical protein